MLDLEKSKQVRSKILKIFAITRVRIPSTPQKNIKILKKVIKKIKILYLCFINRKKNISKMEELFEKYAEVYIGSF